jgi:glycosyltransferase involved in cell wall biosynthesis
MKHRFHVLGVPHTVSSKDYVACAFTQKVVKFCEMMHARGHEIIHYGHADSTVACTENVAVTTNADLEAAYGTYDWKNNQFKFDVKDAAYQAFYSNSITEIAKRKKPLDFLLCFWGSGVKAVADAHSDMLVVEPGIGYPGGIFAPYRVFESQWIMAAWFGMQAIAICDNYSWYDAVIPNYFDLKDFEYSGNKEDYFLHLGRIGHNKGLHIAIQATEEIGAKLIVAGQGKDLKPLGIDYIPKHVEMYGHADVEARKKLMSKARGFFLLSQYGEPFGGAQIEAMLSGTPVISTDWGCFGELNLHGVTGYRCRTFEHITWAAKNIHNIEPRDCREWAMNFTMDRVALMYEEYFDNIVKIHDGSKGWYEPNPDRKNLDWLYRRFPKDKNRIKIA